MGWVKRIPFDDELPPEHECDPPWLHFQVTWSKPDGEVGSLWRCDECGKLLVVAYDQHAAHYRNPHSWQPAGWWLRWRHRERYPGR